MTIEDDVRGVAIKKPYSCSNTLLKKSDNRNIIPFNVAPPRSLHRSVRIFHFGKQCSKISCVKQFKSFVAFVFTASTASNLVRLIADLIFGKRKILTVLGPVITVGVTSLEYYFSPNKSSEIVTLRAEIL